MKTNDNFSSEIETFSANSLYQRTNLKIHPHETIITQSHEKEIIRIIHHINKTFISVQSSCTNTISEYLRKNNIKEKLSSPTFCQEILKLLGYEPRDFLLEPSEEFWQDIEYNCVHTLDFVCTKSSFIPQNTDKVEKICLGDNRFILDESFDNTMYSITDHQRVVSCSYYKPNDGIFQRTCSMQVFTRPEYRKNGYGRMTAAAATQAVMKQDKLALWVCQVENMPSRKIAENLGYILLGGELRIVK
jgi:hypothetical protein